MTTRCHQPPQDFAKQVWEVWEVWEAQGRAQDFGEQVWEVWEVWEAQGRTRLWRTGLGSLGSMGRARAVTRTLRGQAKKQSKLLYFLSRACSNSQWAGELWVKLSSLE